MKEKKYLSRKKRILEAAEQVFGDIGYSDFTIDDIAEKSDFTKPTIYKYFQSKEEIIFAVFLQGKTMELELIKDLERIENNFEKLKFFAKIFFEFHKKHPLYMELVKYIKSRKTENLKISDAYMQEFHSLFSNMRKNILSIVENGQKDGTITKDIDAFTASELYISTLQVIQTKSSNDKNFSAQQAVEIFLRAFK